MIPPDELDSEASSFRLHARSVKLNQSNVERQPIIRASHNGLEETSGSTLKNP